MPDLLWLIGTNTSQNLKRFPEITIHPRVQNTSQNPKICPRTQNTSQNVKTLPRIQNTSQNPKLFWILGCVLDFGKCFWILGSVNWILGSILDSRMWFGFWEVFLNSGKCFVPTSHRRYQSLSLWICFGEANYPTILMVPAFSVSSMQRSSPR